VVDPIFWLGLSILLVAMSLTAVLIAVLPAVRELARAARSAEKLFDTLNRELPPTLEAIRLTGLEISDLTDEVSEGVQSAGQVVKQVDQSIRGAKKQAQQAQVTTRSVFAGVKAAWKSFRRPAPSRRFDRLPASARQPMDFEEYRPRSAANSRRGYAEDYGEDWESQSIEPDEDDFAASEQSADAIANAEQTAVDEATAEPPNPRHLHDA
jgi:uncharacterized protein YoxC